MEKNTPNNITDSIEDNVYLDASDVDEVIELEETTPESVQHEDIQESLSDLDMEDDTASEEVTHDDSSLTFTAHKESVFTVRINQSDPSVAVSGGQDDIAYVWNTKTGDILFPCTGHKDSVTSAAFSHDGLLVATGDLGGLVKVWNCATHAEVWSFDCSDIEWLVWHHSAPVLLCGTVEGDVWMWKIPGGECKTFHGSGAVASCGVLMPDGLRAVVGYDDGEIKVWDLKTGACIHTLSGRNGHSSSVVAMDRRHDNALLMTGSTDSTAKFFNSVTGKKVATFNCAKGDNSREGDSVETVAISPVHNYAAAGTLKGMLHIIDTASLTVRHSTHQEAGIVKARWHHSQPLVYTASLDGVVRCLDARTGQVKCQWSGHTREILDFDVSSDGTVLVTSSDDATVKVYDLR